MDSEILNLACLNDLILEMIISNHELLLTVFFNTFNILLLVVITKIPYIILKSTFNHTYKIVEFHFK